ncbi:hypothetical protein SCP_0502880 [Sparassis crispa]|uniref:BZIP domain-containing protein n=1 Tax=Sparassis crispa TaxID=139825 RepID=A0A401GLZ7_9APHY|nr:hypothetical protein SCP_0502880 [Sparassis crispa]GBE83241.1 hypothetical protein SCP_0502880 [Sparassis crispa]
MLSQNPEERESTAAEAVAPRHHMSADEVAVNALMDVLQASPEFQMGHDFGEYLTSPMDDSPFDEFLTTPDVGSSDIAFDLLTSPAIVDDADDFDVGSGSLFGGDTGLGLNVASLTAFKNATTVSSASSASINPLLNLDGMYTMPSPSTPALDPSSLHPSPRVQALSATSTPAPGRRKNGPTGTRKNIMPELLVPIDAPIQSRKYVTPSATSRKEVPAVFAKKRSLSQAFGDDEEVLLAPSDMDAIEAKRRQNTLAARRSRKRKLEYQRELEMGMEQEREEKEMWKARAQMFEALLRSHGLDIPKFEQ